MKKSAQQKKNSLLYAGGMELCDDMGDVLTVASSVPLFMPRGQENSKKIADRSLQLTIRENDGR